VAYSRARPSWADFPDLSTIVRAQDIEKWDQAVYDLKTQVAYAKDYGALGDGTTNDTTALASALATGKDVCLPQGFTFATTGNTSTTAGQRIFGGGKLKLISGSGGTTLTISADDVTVDGVLFDQQNITDSTGVGVSGNRAVARSCEFTNFETVGVHLRGTSADAMISGNRFNGLGYGVLTASAATITRPSVIGNTFVGGNYGDAIEINTPTGGATDVLIVGNVISGYTNISGGGIGIGCANVTSGLIADNLVYNCGLDGIHIEDRSTGITVSGNIVRSCGRSGISIGGSNNIVVSSNNVVSCITASGEGAIAIEGSQAMNGHSIVGNIVRGNGRAGATCYGIAIAALTVRDCAVNSNVVSNTIGATTAGIRLVATNSTVIGNRCYDDQGTKTQGWGIKSDGASDYLVVVGNNTNGNLTGNISLVGANNVNANNI
jgi:hypothetical protein